MSCPLNSYFWFYAKFCPFWVSTVIQNEWRAQKGAHICEEKHRICYRWLYYWALTLWGMRIIDVSKKNSRTEMYPHSKEMREENSRFPKVFQICLWYSCVVLMLSFSKHLEFIFIFSHINFPTSIAFCKTHFNFTRLTPFDTLIIAVFTIKPKKQNVS